MNVEFYTLGILAFAATLSGAHFPCSKMARVLTAHTLHRGQTSIHSTMPSSFQRLNTYSQSHSMPSPKLGWIIHRPLRQSAGYYHRFRMDEYHPYLPAPLPSQRRLFSLDRHRQVTSKAMV